MRTSALLLSATLLLAACDEPPPSYRFGTNVSGIRFELVSADEGIHPDTSVLSNPRNPFRRWSIGDDTKFQLLNSGGSAGGFYAWATLLARVATGEHQFYTARKLGEIADSNELSGADQATVKQMTIRAYQSVLDNFPDSVTFDATGTTAFRLATPAYKAIVARGGKVRGDWVLVQTADGEEAVQGGRLQSRKDGGN